MTKLRILLADDHVILLEALKRLLQPLYTIVGTATDAAVLVDLAETLRPDIIIADIFMPKGNGLDACERISNGRRSKVIVLTVIEDPEMAAEAMRRGALGYVLKKNAFAELFKAIQTVALGHPYISPSVNNAPMNVTIATTGSYEREEWSSNQQREIS